MEFVHGNCPAAEHLGLESQPLQQTLTWAAVDVDPRHLDELNELGESGSCHLHVELR